MRLRLFRADPHCFWCGKLTFVDVEINHSRLATVDHLYSRLHPEREIKHRQQKGVLHVLACRSCNHRRAVDEQAGRAFIPLLEDKLEFARKAAPPSR